MIRSMTGYGRASGLAAERWSVAVSVRSVNHRYLEVGVRLPEVFWELEQSIRSVAGEYLQRGKVDVSVRLRRAGEQDSGVRVNRAVAMSVVPQLTLLLAELGHSSAMGVGDLVRIPGLLETDSADEGLGEEERAGILEIVRSALEALRSMREVEGKTLAADVSSRLDRVDELRQQAAGQLDTVRKEMAEGFRRRLEEIRREFDVEVSEERASQEIALLLERGDVAEEVTRLGIHVDQTRRLLQQPDTSSGKKLDFLCQEMLREINTFGQKSRSVELRSLVVELKAEVERIREQVQNVE